MRNEQANRNERRAINHNERRAINYIGR